MYRFRVSIFSSDLESGVSNPVNAEVTSDISAAQKNLAITENLMNVPYVRTQ